MNKRVVVLLPKATYDRLVALAQVEDRDPTQQARVILRQALGNAPDRGR